MGLNYVCSNSTYDLSGSEYTTAFDKKKRLNYIVSGTINQLGLTTDTTASVYSPLKFNLSGSDYYIGRSTTWNTTSTQQITDSSVSTSYWTDTLYTYSQAMSCTVSGSAQNLSFTLDGAYTQITNYQQYVASTKSTYTARTSSGTSWIASSESKHYSFSASITSSRIKGSFTTTSYFSSSTTSETNTYRWNEQYVSGTISGNGTSGYRLVVNSSTKNMGSFSIVASTKYTTYSSSSSKTSRISMSGSSTCDTYIWLYVTYSRYTTDNVSNGTAYTYSYRYTATYRSSAVTNEINLNATSTSLYTVSSSTEAKSSTNGVTYNITVNTTTVDSSHNFV